MRRKRQPRTVWKLRRVLNVFLFVLRNMQHGQLVGSPISPKPNGSLGAVNLLGARQNLPYLAACCANTVEAGHCTTSLTSFTSTPAQGRGTPQLSERNPHPRLACVLLPELGPWRHCSTAGRGRALNYGNLAGHAVDIGQRGGGCPEAG